MNRTEIRDVCGEIKRLLSKEAEARSERHKQFNLALIKADSKTARRELTLIYYDLYFDAYQQRVEEEDEFRDGVDEVEDDAE